MRQVFKYINLPNVFVNELKVDMSDAKQTLFPWYADIWAEKWNFSHKLRNYKLFKCKL